MFSKTPVKIWFSSQVAGYIKEKIWHVGQQLEPQADDSLIFEAEVAGTEEVKYWVLGWGPNACVLEPAGLKEKIRTQVAATLALYEKGSKDRNEVSESGNLIIIR
ncbi:MAG: WYL domain-containing protein [Deltaproteobacteria bacterium]|nr:WYL domain-containing protein [Deltaproteobacteria bacterium]